MIIESGRGQSTAAQRGKLKLKQSKQSTQSSKEA